MPAGQLGQTKPVCERIGAFILPLERPAELRDVL